MLLWVVVIGSFSDKFSLMDAILTINKWAHLGSLIVILRFLIECIFETWNLTILKEIINDTNWYF